MSGKEGAAITKQGRHSTQRQRPSDSCQPPTRATTNSDATPAPRANSLEVLHGLDALGHGDLLPLQARVQVRYCTNTDHDSNNSIDVDGHSAPLPLARVDNLARGLPSTHVVAAVR